MAKAVRQRKRQGKKWSLALGLLVVGVLATGLGRFAAAKEKDSESRPSKGKSAEVTRPAAGPAVYTPYEQDRIINQQIEAQWQNNELTPSKRCTDFEFIRRASLDIIGRVATPAEIQDFMKQPSQTRRNWLVNRLLDSEEYPKNWANIWTTWLMTRSGPGRYHEEMQVWLEEQFAKKDRGWDKVVTDILTAEGKNEENGATNFILSHLGEAIREKQKDEGYADFVPLTSRTTRLFLGVQTQCTQCHDHPFNNQLKQADFWGINAFFRQVKGDRPPARGRMALAPTLTLKDDPSVNPDGVVFYEERKGVVKLSKPVFLEKNKDGKKDKKWNPNTGAPRRAQLAEFITTSPNFPRAYVNRMWGHFFGRGFTNPGPVDDFNEQNEVTHPLPDDFQGIDDLKRYSEKPTLLDYLANEFKKYNHNPRELIKWICNSEPYQLSCVANKTNDKAEVEPFFSRMLLKSMSPEQLFESLMTATQAEYGQDKENRKKLRDQWMRALVVNFGDDEGNEITFNGTVVQALLLMNGKELNDAISSKDKGTLAMAMRKKNANPKTVLDDLYLSSLNRYPTQAEVKAIYDEVNLMKQGKVKNRDGNALYQDVFWALLNCNEFLLNH